MEKAAFDLLDTISALRAEAVHCVRDRLPTEQDGDRVIAKSDTIHPCVMSRAAVVEQWQSLFSAWCRLPPDEAKRDGGEA